MPPADCLRRTSENGVGEDDGLATAGEDSLIEPVGSAGADGWPINFRPCRCSDSCQAAPSGGARGTLAFVHHRVVAAFLSRPPGRRPRLPTRHRGAGHGGGATQPDARDCPNSSVGAVRSCAASVRRGDAPGKRRMPCDRRGYPGRSCAGDRRTLGDARCREPQTHSYLFRSERLGSRFSWYMTPTVRRKQPMAGGSGARCDMPCRASSACRVARDVGASGKRA